MRQKLKVVGMILYVAFFGGAIGVLGKFALVSFQPKTLIFLRLLIAIIFFTLILWWKKKLRRAWTLLFKRAPDFFILAFSGIGGGMLLGFWGLSRTTAVNYSILFNISPLFMVVCAVLLLKEKISLRDGMLFVTALIGAGIVITNGKWQFLDFGGKYVYGDLLVLAGAIGWAFYLIYGSYAQHKDPEIDSITLVYNTFIIGAVLLFPYVLYGDGFAISAATGSAIAAVLLLGILSTAVLFYIWFEIIRIEGGVLGGLVTLGENISGAILPILFLGERPIMAVWIGGILIIGAMLFKEFFGKEIVKTVNPTTIA